MRHRGRQQGPWWAAALVVGGTFARLSQLTHSLAGDHAFRQTQTAFGAREYAAHGLHLLHSPLPIFGRALDVPMEFPLFQALGRLLMYTGLDAGSASRLAGLLGFQTVAVLWWLILRRWHGTGLATATLALFEVLPFGLHWGAASLIDFFSVALGLVMVLGFDLSWRSEGVTRWTGWAMGVVGAWSLFLVKVTTVPAAGILLIVSAVLAVQRLGRRAVGPRVLVGLASGPGVGLVLLAVWTRHADQVKDRHAATEFLTSSRLTQWNFGGSRVDPHGWQNILDWAAATSGAWGLTVVLGLALGLMAPDRGTRTLTLGLLTAVLAPVLIFFNLFVVHSYYQIVLYPFLVALGAIGVIRLWEIVRRRSRFLLLVPVAVVAGWLSTSALSPSGRHDVDQFLHESPEPAQVAELKAATPADSRIVAVGCDWDPEVFFFAERSGLMVRKADGDTLAAIWRQNEIGSYHYLVTCDQRVNPADLLPPGTRLRPTAQPDVYRLHQPRSTG